MAANTLLLVGKDRLRYSVDIVVIGLFYVFYVYLFVKKIYSDITGMYYSLSETQGMLELSTLQKMFFYTNLISFIIAFTFSNAYFC